MEKTKSQPVGELRPTQMIFTYGIGAIVDLPYLSVLVMGLDDWKETNTGLMPEIHEDRLLRAVRWELKSPVEKLLGMPLPPESTGMPNPFADIRPVGVPVANFPRWMLCPQCRTLAPINSGEFELKTNAYHPERAQYVHAHCGGSKKPPVAVPARFLVACENGHLDDFPWVEFVHSGPTACNWRLQLIESGPSGEARDLEVRCTECKKGRRLSDAFGMQGQQNLPLCRGRRPHLRDYDPEPCEKRIRAILLGASNLWFPDVLTSLAIPTESARLAQMVEDHWARLSKIETPQLIAILRSMETLNEFYAYSDQELWEAIQRKRQQEENGQFIADPLDLRGPEWELFTHPEDQLFSENFRIRPVAIPEGFENVIERVVLVEQMREVQALIGFTRIDAPGELEDSEEETRRGQRMKISQQPPTWIPATEIHGEGIFIQLKESALQEWLKRPAVQQRNLLFHDSHSRWRLARGIQQPEAHYPGMRYVLLHTFAHALMQQFTLECGYTAASVRERLYSRNPEEDRPARAGLLIYTAAPDSEGTLGGLVGLGEPQELRRHLINALHHAELCASDPLCAEHTPSQDGFTLHAAACHACAFAPETSCERGNKYLDRSVLAPTVAEEGLEFFERISMTK